MPANRNRNQRRHANVLPLASIATWLLLAVLIGSGGLYVVYCKNEVHARGTIIKTLENELLDLRTQNDVARGRVEKLTAPKALLDRRKQDPKKFLSEYIDVTQERLVVVADTSRSTEMRAVSNAGSQP